MIYKNTLLGLLTVIFFMISIYLFNHFSAWLGILLAIAGVTFIINHFYKKLQ